jgi:hypothetical protein
MPGEFLTCKKAQETKKSVLVFRKCQHAVHDFGWIGVLFAFLGLDPETKN